MNKKLIFKNRLREMRNEKGLSQSELAQIVGVSRQTISSIENGQFNPTAKLALILCIALDQKFEDMFYFELSVDFSIRSFYHRCILKRRKLWNVKI